MSIDKNTLRFAALISFLLVLFPLIGYLYHINTNKPTETTTDDIVFICTSNLATRYHSTPDCEGLQYCSRVVRINKAEAEQKGRTPCRLCENSHP